ncbi:MAG: Flp family type IVb pilin [Planctomycetaceae bacterium]|nr:Flp family type IVb pilin [Planctomycetaceae bacterium]
MKTLAGLLRDEEGATAVEYSVMLALIAITLVVSVSVVGFNTAFVFSEASASLEDPSGGFDPAGNQR